MAKKNNKKGKRKVVRSAKSGQFVKKDQAKKNPNETVTGRV